MRVSTTAFASAALPALVAAGTPPTYSGMRIVWSDDFSGSAGDSVDTKVWNIAQGSCSYAHS